MKLKSEKFKSGTHYGLKFDENGHCEACDVVGKAMVDAGILQPVDEPVVDSNVKPKPRSNKKAE